jgi:SAM-dependent methyltransferase
MSDFYRLFEDRFRGDRRMIKSRLEIYLPFVLPLREIYSGAQALDLGCGRGEWLELISEHGFSAQGVDLDEEMLVACYDLGLNVNKGNALAYLRSVPDASQSLVSAFHLVEHLLFEDLTLLVKEALRVLVPAGLLILETPNPENLVVGTSSFYLDPSHQRPIPPELLKFLSDTYGFKRSNILRLNEDPRLQRSRNLTLFDVLAGVSPDYAILAQKDADPDIISRLDGAFDCKIGANLYSLASRFDHQNLQLLERMQEMDVKLNNPFWRITRPLCGLARVQRQLLCDTTQKSKVALRELFSPAIRLFKARPHLRGTLLKSIRKHPRLEQRLRLFAAAMRLASICNRQSPIRASRSHALPSHLSHLTPRARQIHSELKVAIEKKRRENC